MKLKWNVIRNNNKMSMKYSWQHWFWITIILATSLISTAVTSHPLSSYDTLSTSLKSAKLIQSADSFQKTNSNHDKTQLTSGIKSAVVPLISETSDTEDTFGGASELNAELLARDSQPSLATTTTTTSSTPSSSQIAAVTTTMATTAAAVKSPSPATTTKAAAAAISSTSNPPPSPSSPPRREIVAALSLPNVNSTKNSPIIVSSTIATTVLTTVTDESIDNSSQMKTSTASPTTKLIKIEESSNFNAAEPQQKNDEQMLSVKSLNSTTAAAAPTFSNDVVEPISNDYNDTVDIIMTNDINATDLSDFIASERKSKGLIEGFSSEEAKFVNNISSRSTLQVSHDDNEIIVGGDDDLSSEALFDVDEDNGGIAINAALISLICIGVVGSLSAFSIMFVYVYRQRYLNKPQALSDPDSSGYVDDSSIRDNSDELYSLDNDSFLNSLEAMTIQNYWTDSVKHTKL